MEKKRNLQHTLIVGIGNQGDRYRFTYHNAGLLFLEFLKHRVDTTMRVHSSKLFAYAKLPGYPALVASLAFMNESGDAVRLAARYFKASPGEILIAHDDADLPLGKYRIAFDRGPAGHNGVRSVIRALGTQSFWRFRIGIRKGAANTAGREKAEAFVLRAMGERDRLALQAAFEKAIKDEPLFERFRIDGEIDEERD